MLTSPALSYTAMHLSAAVESVRQTKLLQEEEQENENEVSVSRLSILFMNEKKTNNLKIFRQCMAKA